MEAATENTHCLESNGPVLGQHEEATTPTTTSLSSDHEDNSNDVKIIHKAVPNYIRGEDVENRCACIEDVLVTANKEQDMVLDAIGIWGVWQAKAFFCLGLFLSQQTATASVTGGFG